VDTEPKVETFVLLLRPLRLEDDVGPAAAAVAAAPAGQAGAAEKSRARVVATLSNAQVLELYSNWCAPPPAELSSVCVFVARGASLRRGHVR
jgi:hypothetical protein